MTRFATALILSIGIFLQATPALAQETFGESCREDFICSCNGSSYEEIQAQIEGLADVQAGSQACAQACSNFGASGTWELFCEGVSKNQGDIPVPTKAAEEKKEYQVPILAVPIPGLVFTPAQEVNGEVVSNYLGQYIQALYSLAIVIATIGTVLTIMIAGLRWMMARGDAGAVSDAKESIGKAFMAMFILIGVISVTNLVDPELTSLRGLALKKIELVPYTEDTFSDVANLALPDPAGGTNGVPYFSQRDFTQEYGDCPGKDGGKTTIKTSGCGPTSFAMALSYFGVQTDPAQVASVFATEGYRICGRGTNAAGFIDSSIARSSGLKMKHMPSINNPASLDAELAKGNLVIISVGPSRFTGGGHFMLITGKSGNDYSLNDPNSGFKTITRNEVQTIVKYGVSIGKPN